VGTETLICEIPCVGVKVSVAVGVWDGVSVGSSDVDVSVVVGSDKMGEKVADNAVSTNPAMTVCAAAVLISPGLCIVKVGKAHANSTTGRMTIIKEIRLESSIAPPNKF